jgi:hypothetical protein
MGAKTLDAFMNASMEAKENVSPTTVAGSGGMLGENGTSSSMSPSSSSPAATGAASALSGSAVFAGMTGLFTYFLL